MTLENCSKGDTVSIDGVKFIVGKRSGNCIEVFYSTADTHAGLLSAYTRVRLIERAKTPENDQNWRVYRVSLRHFGKKKLLRKALTKAQAEEFVAGLKYSERVKYVITHGIIKTSQF